MTRWLLFNFGKPDLIKEYADGVDVIRVGAKSILLGGAVLG
jgi:hypothetical protein